MADPQRKDYWSLIKKIAKQPCDCRCRCQPVTAYGFAVIVLATPDNAEMHEADAIRFPALCVSTIVDCLGVPVLGAQTVVQHEPTVKLAIEEKQTETVRCLIYKDQAGKLWDDIQFHPVKHVFQTEPLLATQPHTPSPVIDVWDRQWVSKRYEKVRPNNAEVFMFSFRLTADSVDSLL